jgi:hypothetical protein
MTDLAQAYGCHSERSEGSRSEEGLRPEEGFLLHLILHFVQDDSALQSPHLFGEVGA